MKEWIFVGICGFILLTALILIIIIVGKSMRRSGEEIAEKCENYISTLRNSMGEQKKDALAVNMWLAKRTEHTQYYLMIAKQLKYSFAISMGGAIFGLLLFAITICVALIFRENLVISIIPAISAAIVEVFSGLFLIMHRTAFKQIAQFSENCSRDERFYSSVILARDNINEPGRDTVIMDLIEKENEQQITPAPETKNEQQITSAPETKKEQ